MVTVDDEYAMSFPNAEGTVCSYGKIRLDREEWESVDELTYYMDIFSIMPTITLNEGHVVYLNMSGNRSLPGLQEENPFWIESMDLLGNPKVTRALSLNGAVFEQVTHETSRGRKTSVDVKLKTDDREEEITNIPYESRVVRYKLFPDSYVCQKFDVSADIVSGML